MFTFKFPNIALKFAYKLKQIKPEGNITYEYNPLRNYRLSEDLVIPSDIPEEAPTVIEKGSIVDLDTEQLGFSLNNPVEMICQPSYDGSVNIILNDGKNYPKLINSRFTPLPQNRYKIVDRIGNTDTNLYDQDTFSVDTSIYKAVTTIPKISFSGLGYNGNFKVGNYVFYFKLSDADGNETDFIGESSIVTCHIGNINDPHSIRGGIGDENSRKTISFFISNIDTAYDYIVVYYTRSTSGEDGIEVTSAYKIDKKYAILHSSVNLYLTGDERAAQISIDDINVQYFLADKVKAQAACQNILFFGGLHKPTIDYEDFKDLSLRILPFYSSAPSDSIIGKLRYKYDQDATHEGVEYFSAYNIYYNLGYWNKEIYRLGIVWILPDGSLSPVFNIRGRNGIPKINNVENIDKLKEDYTIIPVRKNNKERVSIQISEDFAIGKETERVENSKGVVRITDAPDEHQLYSLGVAIDKEILEELKDKVKGFFLVRQKRVPTVLAQALIMGYDQNSGLPLLEINNTGTKQRVIEGFLNTNSQLVNNYSERLIQVDNSSEMNYTAICPEYDLRQAFFNNLFTGTKFNVALADITTRNSGLEISSEDARAYYVSDYSSSSQSGVREAYITALGDNTPIIRDNYYKFRARAGEAEEAWKSEEVYGSYSLLEEPSTKYVRGIFGPYLGMSKYQGKANDIVNIYIPDYSDSGIQNYFKIRYDDDSPYYAISDRKDITLVYQEYSLNTLDNISYDNIDNYKVSFYISDKINRGDCFICNYTHRLNRNFQDPEAPNNDEIVDPNTWKDNYTKGDSEKNAKINRGDVNAVQLGSWITFRVCSNINLSMRNWDDSQVSEVGLTGKNRGFYPLFSIAVDGNNKMPESFVINAGESSTTSDKYNFILPDVPYIKNEFGTRIVYSDVAVNDAFKNGFRVFQANHYRDYPMIYGGIMKLVELYGNLLCIFEHGVALIPVNEIAIAGEGAGGNVYINTSNVLPENPKMLSDMFGSQWPESVIKTPYYVYGVDTVAKKIWRTNGQQFEVISDFKIQKFLNDNITLSERELTPIIGVRNVKTHYNAFKGDVMFTFYDNLYGFEEKAWNICYNEIMQKWITLYSWMPSYSENIDNIFFSFNRNTSKWISKLGTSNAESISADGITLSKVVFEKASDKAYLGLANRALPNDKGTSLPDVYFEYSLIDDNFGNHKMFKIGEEDDIVNEKTVKKAYLYFIGNQEELESKQVWLLNAKVEIKIAKYSGQDTNIKNYINGWKEYTTINYGYYQSVIAVTSHNVLHNSMLTEKEKQSPNLSTDFWKHGQSGIIDIKEKIRPCYWYGEQHPFEFEYVVADNPGIHKIFTNLQLISNKAKPESFHYEIVGESYDWADDKKNIYVRQEATKKLYQNLGSDILYNRNYEELAEGKYVIEQDPETNKNKLVYKTPGIKCNPKSTIFPWYYERIDTFNDIYDCYQIATSKYGRNYQNLSGTEVIYDEQLNEFRLWTHSKAWDMKEVGRLRGNCQYQEDSWLVVIPSINFRQKNEDWEKLPPIILNNIPNDIKEDTITTESLPKFSH